jgi:hypothetical protein
MGVRATLAKPLAKVLENKNMKWAAKPVETQGAVLKYLLGEGAKTQFGTDRKLGQIKTHKDFIEAVPVTDYEGLKGYMEAVKEGKPDVLWPGKPLYFAKTSGTTSGVKYIPITKASAPYHVGSARDAVFSYVHETGKSKFLDNKLIFLSGSPEMSEVNGIQVGRLSGIVNHLVPGWLRTNQLPSYSTNSIEDWEEKLDAIIGETINQKMGLISGIPPWVQMYFDRIVAKTGKPIKDVFPDFSMFVYGGVNFEPYRKKLFDTIGKKIDSIETYPASEGFFAYQDSQEKEGLLLLLNSGIYYEFVPAEEFFNEKPTRLSIGEVKTGVNYAMIISTNAGLWGYSMGDTVRFVSLAPYRILVTGRIKHFISAFGEHVIGEEVEKALKATLLYHPEVEVVEFTVAPNVNPNDGLPRHEWYMEFSKMPHNMPAFERRLDEQMRKLNIYYDDLITGSILESLHVKSMPRDTFINYMRRSGKLGGQNKVPRLSNDRKLVDALV